MQNKKRMKSNCCQLRLWGKLKNILLIENKTLKSVIPMALCLRMRTQKETPVKYCTATVSSSLHPLLHLFFGRMVPSTTFILSFSSCVSTYLFIIVDMIFSLHSDGHWIMTFHEDLLNRVLGTEVSKKNGILVEVGKADSPLSLIPD